MNCSSKGAQSLALLSTIEAWPTRRFFEGGDWQFDQTEKSGAKAFFRNPVNFLTTVTCSFL
jgi:hypothetical protein